MNYRYSKDDDDYYYELEKVKPKCCTIEDMIAFYRMWFDTYNKVVEEWDDVNEP